jgi:hypothetical protein
MTLRPIKNGGDAVNQNTRKLAFNGRTVLTVEFHPSTTSQDCPFEPIFLARLSRANTKCLPIRRSPKSGHLLTLTHQTKYGYVGTLLRVRPTR